MSISAASEIAQPLAYNPGVGGRPVTAHQKTRSGRTLSTCIFESRLLHVSSADRESLPCTFARNPTKIQRGSSFVVSSANAGAKSNKIQHRQHPTSRRREVRSGGVRRFEPGTRPFLHLCRADMRFRGDDLAIAGSFEVQRSAGARR